MAAKTKGVYRYLNDVSDDELIKAVTEMAGKLGIPGSAPGYSLYEAILVEKQKMLEQAKIMEDDVKE